MKKVFFLASLSLFCLYSNAQLQVLTSGQVSVSNKQIITIGTGTNFDALDIVNNSTSLTSSSDLIWGCYPNYQYNNPGLLKLSYQYVPKFLVKTNGFVGICNSNPTCQLDITGIGKINGAVILTSDARLKENIVPMAGSKSALLKLNAVTFNFKYSTEDYNYLYHKELFQDTTKNKRNIAEPEFYQTKRIGFIAQDVETVFPELIYKDSSGILSMDYIGLIPILVESLKEQDKQITEQNKKIAELESRVSALESILNNDDAKKNSFLPEINESIDQDVPSLAQNIPNPFNKDTEIAFYLPPSTSNAELCIYNLNGTLLKTNKISETGLNKIIIRGSELVPGIYLYSLIVNGMEVDTKRMILTDKL